MKRILIAVLLILVTACSCIYLPASPTNPSTQTPPAATPVAQVPVISSFSANPPTIQPGDSSTLSWSINGATSVSIDNGIGNVAVSGTRAVTPQTNTVYTLTAMNSAGSATATTQVIVSGSSVPAQPPQPTQPTSGMPVINLFNISPNSITSGGTATLSWNVSNAASVTIQPGIGNVAAAGSTAISPTTTTMYTLTASNSAGSAMMGTQVLVISSGGTGPTTPVVPLPHIPLPLVTIVYNFIDQASTASWVSGSGSLPFPGPDTDSRGFTLTRDNVTLEDGQVYTKALETHPEWITNGFISGAYIQMSSTYTVQASDHFYSKIGFMKGASAGNVRYKVMIRPEGGPNVWIVDMIKTYNGALVTLDVPLSAYAGKKADFILEVDANNPSATQDWACWVNTEITR